VSQMLSSTHSSVRFAFDRRLLPYEIAGRSRVCQSARAIGIFTRRGSEANSAALDKMPSARERMPRGLKSWVQKHETCTTSSKKALVEELGPSLETAYRPQPQRARLPQIFRSVRIDAAAQIQNALSALLNSFLLKRKRISTCRWQHDSYAARSADSPAFPAFSCCARRGIRGTSRDGSTPQQAQTRVRWARRAAGTHLESIGNAIRSRAGFLTASRNSLDASAIATSHSITCSAHRHRHASLSPREIS